MKQSVPNRKSYAQACTMANALDYVGDRWTILILRELLGGMARFNDLRKGLPGIPSNLLAGRLRQLEEDALVDHKTVYGSEFYQLTDAGEKIRTALEELAIWAASLARIQPVRHDRSARSIAMALQALLVRAGDALQGERALRS